jgi:hypothetical protein
MASRYDLLFEQWKATLAGRDRRTPSVQGNFEELFDILKNEGLVLENAYEYLPKAVRAHAPSPSLVKTMFKKLKGSPKFQYSSEREFEEQWTNDIEERAKIAFFNIFPIPTKKKEEDDEPPLFGSMTAKEYKMQREHADSFPRLTVEEIQRRRAAALAAANYNPMDEIDSILGKGTSGDSN